MMKKLQLLLAWGVLFPVSVFAQEIYMIGPMIHFNFSEHQCHVSYAIEASYWNIDHFPYSADVGLEFEKGKFRIYSEAQTGVGLIGVASGPFIEFAKDKGVRGGLQLS